MAYTVEEDFFKKKRSWPGEWAEDRSRQRGLSSRRERLPGQLRKDLWLSYLSASWFSLGFVLCLLKDITERFGKPAYCFCLKQKSFSLSEKIIQEAHENGSTDNFLICKMEEIILFLATEKAEEDRELGQEYSIGIPCFVALGFIALCRYCIFYKLKVW